MYPPNYSVLQVPTVDHTLNHSVSGYGIFSNCSASVQVGSRWFVLETPFYLQYLKILNSLRLWLKWIPSFVDFQFYETMKAWAPEFFFQLQVPAGSWISIDSDIISCNNWDVWDSQNTQKRFLAVKNYFKEMFHCYVWRCLCMWHGLWRYKLWFLHHCTQRMAHGGCPSSNNHKTWTRRQTLQKLEFKGWNLKPNNPS